VATNPWIRTSLGSTFLRGPPSAVAQVPPLTGAVLSYSHRASVPGPCLGREHGPTFPMSLARTGMVGTAGLGRDLLKEIQSATMPWISAIFNRPIRIWVFRFAATVKWSSAMNNRLLQLFPCNKFMVPPIPLYPDLPPQLDFFSILSFLINIWEMNLRKSFFLNLALLSHVSPSDAIYEEVTPVHLARLTSMWTSDATSIRSVPPQLLVSKMSHGILNAVTLVWVAAPLLAWLILGQN
jgi:hypothetical protein